MYNDLFSLKEIGLINGYEEQGMYGNSAGNKSKLLLGSCWASFREPNILEFDNHFIKYAKINQFFAANDILGYWQQAMFDLFPMYVPPDKVSFLPEGSVKDRYRIELKDKFSYRHGMLVCTLTRIPQEFPLTAINFYVLITKYNFEPYKAFYWAPFIFEKTGPYFVGNSGHHYANSFYNDISNKGLRKMLSNVEKYRKNSLPYKFSIHNLFSCYEKVITDEEIDKIK